MRAIEAETFSGYRGLRQIELPKPQPAKGRVLVRVRAAGVTPLDHTILSGGHPRAKVPLVLGTNLEHDAAPLEMQLTDRAGRASFTMPHDGTWLLNVIWTTPLPRSRETDFETIFSSLSFGFTSGP